jgi:hypothetical protein
MWRTRLGDVPPIEDVADRLARGGAHQIRQRRLAIADDGDQTARLPALGQQRRRDGLRWLLGARRGQRETPRRPAGCFTLPTVTSTWRLFRLGTARRCAPSIMTTISAGLQRRRRAGAAGIGGVSASTASILLETQCSRFRTLV